LKAFLTVDRAAFVPESDRGSAHRDSPLSIGFGQTISQPYMVACMLDHLRVRPGMRVLEVGAGSGYVLALLSAMGALPFGVEFVPGLAERLRRRLESLGYWDIPVREGDGGEGWPERAPFHRILVSAACPAVPEPLLGQLADGGIALAPTGGAYSQILEKVCRTGEGLHRESLCGCIFVPLRGPHGFS